MTSTATRANASAFADQALESANQAVNATRGLAHDAADTAQTKAREFKRDIEPAVDQWTARVQDAARRGYEAALQSTDRARQSLSQGVDAAGRLVAEQPVKSVLIAAAAGAAITALIVLASRRRDY